MARKNGKRLSHNHLAEGEVTGHFHAAEGAVVFEHENGVRTFDCSRCDVAITHQEHKPIQMPRKKMASGQVREMDHFEEAARTVRD